MLFRPPRKRLPAHKASWEKKASCSPVNEIRGANSSRGRVGSPFRLARPRSASPCRRTCEPCLFISLPIFPFLFRSQRWKCPLRERPALHRFFLFDGVPRPGARGPDPQHHANLRRPPPSAAFFYRATSPQGSRLPLPPRGRRRGTGSSSCPWASWGLGAEVGLGLPGAHACPDPRRPAQRGEGDVESRGAAPLRPGAVPRGWAWPRGGPPPRHAPARGHVTRVGAGARWARPGARVRARGRWRCCCSRPPRVGPAPSPRLDMGSCNRTSLCPGFQDASTAVVIDLTENPLEKLPDASFLGFTSLQSIAVPLALDCPGGSAAWENITAGADSRLCQGQRNACNSSGELAWLCPENSQCAPNGPGLVQCLCWGPYHGYKCLREGTFPMLLFYGVLGAVTAALSLLVWGTQRRKAKAS
ncbi:all-trans retinoic acid-induced differentiation factor isoform X2 [Alligator mississippiensis]|uniref:all-trans retinoic acid-induced differentiation factor isoform X2 n=1 Tax=Alligator mississippiensis TaxID=8496 RepID=UPI002877A4F6|nr:all-trans retinoic acid-induced differentiation factor isoform X2 [Alligator mississippiensis]